MIPKNLTTQLAMLAVSVGIIFTYVEPTFSLVKANQDKIVEYQSEIKKVSEVSAQLDSLVSKMESVSSDDISRLNTYMPNSVDVIAVSRDLLFMVKKSGTQYKSVGFLEGGNQKSSKQTNEDGKDPKEYTFSLTVGGSYKQLKELINLIEQNNYPLEIQSADITSSEGGFIGLNLNLTTYGQK